MTENSPMNVCAEISIENVCLVENVCLEENSIENVCLDNSSENIILCAENSIENVCLENSPEDIYLEESIENVCLKNSPEIDCLENSPEIDCLENSPEIEYLENSPENVILETTQSNAPKDTSKPNRVYRRLWEKEEEFEGWLTQGSSKDRAYCKWCNREFRAHKSTLTAHAASESHKRIAATSKVLPVGQIAFVNITALNGTPLVASLSSSTVDPCASIELNNSTSSTTPRSSTIASINYLPFSSKKGQIIGSGQKRLIVNLYTYKQKIKKVPKYQIPEEIHAETGLGIRSIKEIIKEYLVTGTVKSPTRKRPNCRNCYEKLNATQIELIRNKIQKYFGLKEVPTINKMLEDVNADPDLPSFKKTSFHRVLHHLGYEWVRRGRNRLLVEQKELKAWKEKYLENFLEYRTDGLDETWLNVADAVEKSESE